MPHRNDIIAFLHAQLNVTAFDDTAVNGLQVEGKADVRKIALGVSCSERLFPKVVHSEEVAIIEGQK